MRRILILVLPAALLLGSCLSSGADASRLVSKDAYAALVAESPAALAASIEDFVRAAGLDRFTDGKSLLEKLGEESKGGDLMHAAAALDFGRPIALVVSPDREDGTTRTAVSLWLPLKKGRTSFDALREAMTGFDGEASMIEGYAALALQGPAPSAFPSERADLSRLSGYPADSLKAWVNLEALRADFRDRWGDALTGALSSAKNPGEGPKVLDSTHVEPSEPEGPYNYNERNFDWDEYYGDSEDPDPTPAGVSGVARGVEELLKKAAENVRTLDFALSADRRGFWLRMGASVYPDRALGSLAASAGPARGIPFQKYLESGALAGGASSFDSAALASFVERYIKALGMDSLLGAKYFDFLKSIYASTGPDSAFSFDATIAPDFMERAGRIQAPEEISALLRDAVSFEIWGASSLRDRDRYRASLRSLGDVDLFGDAFRELMASSGVDLGFSVDQGTVEGVPYDSIRLKLDGKDLGEDPTSRIVLDALLAKLTFHAGYAKDKAYLVMGDPAKLPVVVRRDGAAAPVSEDKTYAAFAAALPKTARGVYFLSLRRIFDLVAPFSKGKFELPREDLDRFYGYFAAETGALETGFFLGSGDIRALVGLLPEGRAKSPELF